MIFSDQQIAGKLFLKEGRDFAPRQGHPWVFSGAVGHSELNSDFQDGRIVEVYCSRKKLLGIGFYNRDTSLALRFLSFSETPGNCAEVLQNNLDLALLKRKNWLPSNLNCYRLINAEGDMLPGIIADLYAGTLVLQLSTRGAELLKAPLIAYLVDKLKPQTIFERSCSSSRKEEGLEDCETLLYGRDAEAQIVQEYNLKLLVDVKNGQKTGFFIDQREMRNLVYGISAEKRVLNCFSYTGGFSIAALLGGASRVVSVDSSSSALEVCKRDLEINCINPDLHEAKCVDAFDYLAGTHENFDLIVLDPPAFAKQRKDLKNALRAYYKINHSAARLLKPGGMLITCSCSNIVSQQDFELEVLNALRDSNKNRALSIVGRHRHGIDHPVLAAHREGNYLKSLCVTLS